MADPHDEKLPPTVRSAQPSGGVPADLTELEAESGSIGRLKLMAWLRADQLQRWEQGQPLPAEQYLEQLAPLKADEELALDLIYSEILVREQLGEKPALEEYVRRFPQFEKQLRAQLAVHAVIEGAGLGSVAHLPETPLHASEVRPPRTASPPTRRGDMGVSRSSASTLIERPEIPGYQVLGILGRGGMGIVYKAQQVQLKRLVALKMIKGSQATPEDLARFRAEAEAVARLRHANIVQIYDIGEHDDRPFFCLEFVEGGSLAAKVGGKPVPGRLAAQLVETLARTMHYAHQHGIVHRDLKPANVLLTGGPDTPLAQCIPKITDFGLAKQLDADTGQTRSGAILGTPSYMAPEQAAGWIKQVGPLADVYALGAILYELLTGRPPFREATVLDTLDRVRRQEPTPPSQLQRRVPRDLETICLKCLEKEPLRRYSSAQALADDLQAFLRGEPITARPQTRLERLLRWRRQHPAAALLGAISLIALVALVVGIWWHNALAFSAAAVISLVVGGGWFYYRLQEALLRLDQQHLLAQRQLERLHLLLEMTQRLIGAPDLDSLLRLISETTTRLANAERATIFLIDHQKQELWSKVAMGDGIQEIRIPLGVGIAGAVADSGETINLADPYADPRFNREVDRQTGYRTRNLLAIPMRGQNGRIIGVFQVLNKLGGPFLPDDVEPLSALAASAALALENAQRFNSERVL